MASAKVVLDWVKAMSDVNLTFTVRHKNYWRVRLGMWLVRLGVKICGAKSTIEAE
jgi:hypothetical protein